jgi:predicted N-acetyltransferase YhbS
MYMKPPVVFQMEKLDRPGKTFWDTHSFDFKKGFFPNMDEVLIHSLYRVVAMEAESREEIAFLDCEFQYGWLFVKDLFVNEDWRRQGVGSELWLFAEKFAKRKGVKACFVPMMGYLPQEFFEKNGFSSLKETPASGSSAKMIFMEKTIS